MSDAEAKRTLPVRLILFRHGKAAWEADGGSDHARPLTSRGRNDVRMMAGWLEQHDVFPDEIIVSNAMRTMETLACLVFARALPISVSIRSDLYLAPAGRILNITNQRKTFPGTLMVVGHNPGLQQLALHLITRTRPSDEKLPDVHLLMANLPTSGAVILEARNDHQATSDEAAWELMHFVTPRMLKEAEVETDEPGI